MDACQTDERAAGERVPVRALDGVPVRQRHQPAAPRRHRGSRGLQRRVGPTVQGRVAELRAEPAGEVRAGVLHDLEHVLTGQPGGVGPVHGPVPVRRAVHPGHDRRTEVEVRLVRTGRAAAQPCSLPVPAARDDHHRPGQRPSGEDVRGHLAHRRTGGYELGQLVVPQPREAHETGRERERRHVVQPQAVSRRRRVAPLTGERVDQIAVYAGDPRRRGHRSRLVPRQPGDLVQARRHVGLEPGLRVHGLVAQLRRLHRGPAVEPQDAGPDGPPVRVHQRERLPLGRDAERRDAGAVGDRQPGHGLPYRLVGAAPPVRGVLLVHVDARRQQRDLGAARADHDALGVDDQRLRGGRRRVHGDDERFHDVLS